MNARKLTDVMLLGRSVRSIERRLGKRAGSDLSVGQPSHVATSPPAPLSGVLLFVACGRADVRNDCRGKQGDYALSRRVRPVCEGPERTARPEWLASTVINRRQEVNRIVKRVLAERRVQRRSRASFDPLSYVVEQW